MGVLQQLLEANRAYVQAGTRRGLSPGVSRKLVVLTCMDSSGAHAALFHPTSVLEHVKAKAGEALGIDTGGIDMHPIYDLDGSIREDVAALRASDRIRPTTALFGLALDTATGALREVCSDVTPMGKAAGASSQQ